MQDQQFGGLCLRLGQGRHESLDRLLLSGYDLVRFEMASGRVGKVTARRRVVQFQPLGPMVHIERGEVYTQSVSCIVGGWACPVSRHPQPADKVRQQQLAQDHTPSSNVGGGAAAAAKGFLLEFLKQSSDTRAAMEGWQESPSGWGAETLNGSVCWGEEQGQGAPGVGILVDRFVLPIQKGRHCSLLLGPSTIPPVSTCQ